MSVENLDQDQDQDQDQEIDQDQDNNNPFGQVQYVTIGDRDYFLGDVKATDNNIFVFSCFLEFTFADTIKIMADKKIYNALMQTLKEAILSGDNNVSESEADALVKSIPFKVMDIAPIITAINYNFLS